MSPFPLWPYTRSSQWGVADQGDGESHRSHGAAFNLRTFIQVRGLQYIYNSTLEPFSPEAGPSRTRSSHAAAPRSPPEALCGGISKVNFQQTLSSFCDKCPQNGSKTAPTAPRPHLGYPHIGSSVGFSSPTRCPTRVSLTPDYVRDQFASQKIVNLIVFR